MPEGLVAESRSAAVAAGGLRVRLRLLPASVQLMRRVVSEVLGAEPAETFSLVVVSAADGIRSLPAVRLGAHLRIPLSALVVDVPDGVTGDEPGHLIATVSSADPAAERLHALRRRCGVKGEGAAWMRLTDTPASSARVRCGGLGPRLAGTRFAEDELVFGGLELGAGGVV